jgi:hypothetical protein
MSNNYLVHNNFVSLKENNTFTLFKTNKEVYSNNSKLKRAHLSPTMALKLKYKTEITENK